MNPVLPAHPSEFDALKQLIADRFEQLPARLQMAARYLIDHPNEAAVETIKSLSTAARLQPSGLVRLAQALGYKGFSEMQAVFRSALLAQTQSYGERMRAQRRHPQNDVAGDPDDLLRVLCDGSIQSLESLRDANDSGALRSAIALLASARSIHVLGLRRAWPIATYLVYLLSRAQRMVRLLGGMGGMLPDELRTLTPADLLVAISFQPFHADTLTAVEQAKARGIPVLVLSDSSLSSLARNADVVLEARDTDTLGFRSVSASMVLCQGLAVGLAMADSAAARPRASRARPRKA